MKEPQMTDAWKKLREWYIRSDSDPDWNIQYLIRAEMDCIDREIAREFMARQRREMASTAKAVFHYRQWTPY